jgi:hypothetical protein
MSGNAHLGFNMQSNYLPTLLVIRLPFFVSEVELGACCVLTDSGVGSTDDGRRAEPSSSQQRPAEQIPTRGTDLVETATSEGALRVHLLPFPFSPHFTSTSNPRFNLPVFCYSIWEGV